MNVVDSSGWIEYFAAGPNAAFFEDAIRDTQNLVVPSISVFEVYRYVLGKRGREDALTVAATMLQGQEVVLDVGLAVEAAEVAAQYGLPLADSIIYASAILHEATLWTQDADFEDLDRVKYRPKASAG